MIVSGEAAPTVHTAKYGEGGGEVSEASPKCSLLVVGPVLLSRSIFKLSLVNLTQSQTIYLHVVSLHSIILAEFFFLTGRHCGSNNLERQFKFSKEWSKSTSSLRNYSAMEPGLPQSRERRRCRSAVLESATMKEQRWVRGTQLRKAPAGASEPAGTDLTNTTQAELPRVASARSQAMLCATYEVSRRDGTSRHSAQSIFSKTTEPGLGTTSRNTSTCGIFPWHHCPAPEDANNFQAHWNIRQQAQATRGIVMVLAALWKTRRDMSFAASQGRHTSALGCRR